ncbi:hypothetical protein B4U79_19197, partial [Dinothrombium tinctorium]
IIDIIPVFFNPLHDEISNALRKYNTWRCAEINNEERNLGSFRNEWNDVVRKYKGKENRSVKLISLEEIHNLRQRVDQSYFVERLFSFFVDDHVAENNCQAFVENDKDSDECEEYFRLSLDRFPDEVLMNIINFLPGRDLISLRAVSRRFKCLTELRIKKRFPKTLIVTKNTLIHSVIYTGLFFPNIAEVVIGKKHSSNDFSPSSSSISLNLTDICDMLKEKLHTVKRLFIRKNIGLIGSQDENYLIEHFPSLETLEIQSIFLFEPFENLIVNSRSLRKLSLIRFKMLHTESKHRIINLPSTLKTLKLKWNESKIDSQRILLNNELENLILFDVVDFEDLLRSACDKPLFSLKKLNLLTRRNLSLEHAFFDRLHSLKRLTLFAKQLTGTPLAERKCFSVEELSINIKYFDDQVT